MVLDVKSINMKKVEEKKFSMHTLYYEFMWTYSKILFYFMSRSLIFEKLIHIKYVHEKLS